MPVALVLPYELVELITRYKLNNLGENIFTLIHNPDMVCIRGQRRSSVAGLTEDDRQTVDKERQVGDPMQLRTEVLNL